MRERVAKQYVPGVTEVDAKRSLLKQATDTLDKKTDSEDQPDQVIFKPDDGKWRPVVVTLGTILTHTPD